MVANLWIGNDMVAPLVGIAVAAAARLAAKKLAQAGAKKAAKSATGRARSNSAAAAKAVAPKKPKGPVKVLTLVPARKTSTGAIKINSNPVKKKIIVSPVPAGKKLSPSAEKSLAEIRKTLGSSKPDPKAFARKMTQDKAREMERIRKQGRNTR
jgi:hypothetical protein